MLEALVSARKIRRADLLDELTHVEDGVRVFTEDATIRHLPKRERAAVEKAFDVLPGDDPGARSGSTAELFYDLRDVVGKSGFGIGSAGLPAYNLLVEGYSQALDNDVVLSMKQANIPALSRFADSADVDQLLRARGPPHGGQPAGAAGAHRPAAGVRRDGRRRLRGLGGLAVRGGPGLGEHHRARRDGRRGRPAGPRHREGALRLATRTATRTSSTSRWRARSSPR